MYKLPYITIPTKVLVPHTSNSFTITLKKTESELLVTKTIKLDNIIHEDSFIIIVANTDQDFSMYATLATLDAKAELEDSWVYHFSTKCKVAINDVNKNHCKFTLIEQPIFTLEQKQNYLALCNFIKNNMYLTTIKDNVDLNNTNYTEVLNQIINYLEPTQKQDYNFYNTIDLNIQISLINLLIIRYEADFTTSTKNKKYPKQVFNKIYKEKQRLKLIPISSNEYSSTLDYLDVIENLPWNSLDKYKPKIDNIKNNLNISHYGLTDVKEHIIDHFAFEELTQKPTGVILLFNGPPGTGKTSIAKAIAKATDRDFISISLGGLNDESEIRGHRRTYIGSRPGRFIAALKNLQTNNPVILLDEIDKISSTSKGNPEAALLEILDTEQNDKFLDRYLELPFDFSNALFICTSNNSQNISKPLLNRLEVIEFRKYSSQEKYNIVYQHIIPSLLKKYNLETYNIIFSESFIKKIIIDNDLRNIKKIILRLLKSCSRNLLTGCHQVIIDLSLYNELYKNKPAQKRIGF
jgi:endopeptidase La